MKRPRVAVVTPFFPIREEPFRGHSAYQALRRMTDWGHIEAFCPLATYPKARFLQPRRFRYQRADLSYSPPDLQAHYFEYPALPMVTRPINGWSCLRELLPYLRKFKPDLLLNYWLYPEGFAAVQAGRKLGVPAIVRSIGSDLRRIADPVTRYFTRRTLKEAAFVLTASRDLARVAIGMGAPERRCQAILNGCDITIFHPRDRAAMRRQLGLPAEGEIVVFVGSLLSSKGLFDLLDAAHRLIVQRPRLRFYLIGAGPARGELEQAAATGGLGERVVFVGKKSSEEVAAWIGAADLFCLPSHSEGCPNVVIEAIACGRAVIATDVGGIPELVDAQSGILAPPRRPDLLEGAIREGLGRRWDEALIAATYQRSWEQVAGEMIAVCERVLGESGEPGHGPSGAL